MSARPRVESVHLRGGAGRDFGGLILALASRTAVRLPGVLSAAKDAAHAAKVAAGAPCSTRATIAGQTPRRCLVDVWGAPRAAGRFRTADAPDPRRPRLTAYDLGWCAQASWWTAPSASCGCRRADPDVLQAARMTMAVRVARGDYEVMRLRLPISSPIDGCCRRKLQQFPHALSRRIGDPLLTGAPSPLASGRLRRGPAGPRRR